MFSVDGFLNRMPSFVMLFGVLQVMLAASKPRDEVIEATIKADQLINTTVTSVDKTVHTDTVHEDSKQPLLAADPQSYGSVKQ